VPVLRRTSTDGRDVSRRAKMSTATGFQTPIAQRSSGLGSLSKRCPTPRLRLPDSPNLSPTQSTPHRRPLEDTLPAAESVSSITEVVASVRTSTPLPLPLTATPIYRQHPTQGMSTATQPRSGPRAGPSRSDRCSRSTDGWPAPQHLQPGRPRLNPLCER
jgi:hypothetical protein